MNTISVCIPTHNRPEFLREALESCRIQAIPSLQIVVGDDSTEGDSRDVVDAFRSAADWTIDYEHNVPKLGQNDNVGALLRRANGEFVVVLHDDDRLLPGALAALRAPFRDRPELAVTFGKQAIIARSGARDDRATVEANLEYDRTGPSRPIPDPLVAGLLQQIPNDGFMVRRSVAIEIGYRSHTEIGEHYDVDFAVRLGAAIGSANAYFVDAFVSEYRRRRTFASHVAGNVKSAIGSRELYESLANLPIDSGRRSAKNRLIARFADGMVKGLAKGGRQLEALRLYLSRNYGWRRRLSLRGAYHLALIAYPGIDGFKQPRG